MEASLVPPLVIRSFSLGLMRNFHQSARVKSAFSPCWGSAAPSPFSQTALAASAGR